MVLFCVSTCFCLGWLGPLAYGQNAQLSGLVKDKSEAVVAGASVSLTNTDTGIVSNTKSNDKGFFVFPSVTPGRYSLAGEASGFSKTVIEHIKIDVASNLSQDIVLQVKSSSDTVTVEGTGLNVNTTDASVSTIVDRQFVENLPMNGRSFQTLIYLTPGVTLAGVGGQIGWATGQFSVNGQRTDSNYWMVDGVSGNISGTPWYLPGNGAAGGLQNFNVLGSTSSLVSVDAMQEFRIQTSTYAPEFGREPGGQISILTRSGTNQFHGTLFDYFRNTVLDAEDWFASANGLPKAAERQNDFGGVVGGPIVKDKTFFFFSYEGLRLSLPQTQLTTVPDAAARANAIPAVQPFIDAYPLPPAGATDVGPGYVPYNVTFTNPATVDAYSIRVDHALTKTLNLFGRYMYSPTALDQRAAFGSPANTVYNMNIDTWTLTTGATWTKSSEIVDEARFNYSRAGGELLYTMDTFGGGGGGSGRKSVP
jgi:hypothetical protein